MAGSLQSNFVDIEIKNKRLPFVFILRYELFALVPTISNTANFRTRGTSR